MVGAEHSTDVILGDSHFVPNKLLSRFRKCLLPSLVYDGMREIMNNSFQCSLNDDAQNRKTVASAITKGRPRFGAATIAILNPWSDGSSGSSIVEIKHSPLQAL